MKNNNITKVTQTTDIDFEVFFSLRSLYYALRNSVTSPVVLPSGLTEGRKASTFSHIYWDAHEDEKMASETMKRRISLDSGEISQYLETHERLLNNIHSIDKSVERNDRESVGDAIISLCYFATSYVGLVVYHRNRLRALGEEPFLSYPTCLPGHYFYDSNFDKIKWCSFNPTQNSEGAAKDINNLLSLDKDFKTYSQKLVQVKVIDDEHQDEGLRGTSLRSRLVLTKELLKRVGYAP